MANRTDTQADTVHGTNPQYLVDRIVRNKIYNDAYWKEFCFGLTTETLIDRAAEIDYVGGTYGGRRRPAKFLCLFLKMLQIQPDEDVVLEYIKQPDLKYLRALGAAYYRISQRHIEVYQTLEPLFADYRKLRFRDITGKLSLIHMDEFIDWLFREKTVCDVTMPGIPKREILESTLEIPPRQSVLEDDLEDLEDLEEEMATAAAGATEKADGDGPPPSPEAAAASAEAEAREGSASPKAARSKSKSPGARSRSPSGRVSEPRRSEPRRSEPRRSKSRGRRRKARSVSRSASAPRRKEKARKEERDDRKDGKRKKDDRRDRDVDRRDRDVEPERSERAEKAEKKDKKDKKEKEKKGMKFKGDKAEQDRAATKPRKDKDGLSVNEWDEIRKQMGLKPLQR